MKFVKSVFVEILGWLLMAIGIALLVLPGPGIIVILGGITLLSTRYHWARKIKHKAREWAIKATEKSAQSRKHILLSALFSVAIGVFGFYIYSNPITPEFIRHKYWIITIGEYYPYSGPTTGTILIVSSVLSLVVLVYSVIKYGKKND